MLAALFGFLVFLVWNIRDIKQFNLGAPSFVVYVIAAVLAALLLFGVMHSSGNFKSLFPGFCIELGGSAALFATVLFAGLSFEKSQPGGEFAVTFYLHPAANDREILNAPGHVTLLTLNSPKQTFNDGKAKFEDLPKSLNGKNEEYAIKVEGYELSADSPKSLLLKPNAVFHLKLLPKAVRPETVQVQVRDIPKESLAKKLEAAMKMIGQLKSPEERLTKAADLLQQFKDAITSSDDLEVAARAATLHLLLAYEYGVMNNSSKECAELDKSFANLKLIYDKDPSWTPPTQTPTPPVALAITRNRVDFAFAAIAELNAETANTTREKIAEQIDIARETLRKSNAPVPVNAIAWLSICTVHMANSQFLAAKVDLTEAIRLIGEPTNPIAERMDDKQIYFEYYLLSALVNAECRDVGEAVRYLEKAKDHRIEGDPQGYGKVGFVFLQIARAATSKEDTKTFLESAIDAFRHADGCLSCRYSSACARSMLAKLVDTANSGELIAESRKDLTYAIQQLEECPLQPDIEAIKEDPYLSLANDSEDIRNALRAFKWKNNPHPSKRIPMEIAWKSDLWHFGVPLKRLRFSVLRLPLKQSGENE